MVGARWLERAEDNKGRLARTTPLLLVAGSRDPVSLGGFANSQLASRYRAAGNESVTVRRYRGARHELVNETIRAEFLSDLIGWMNQLIAGPAGPR